MKKGQKMTKGYKPWETMLLNGEVKGVKATMEDTKRKGPGMAPSPALVAIIERVLKMQIEDPLKYPFPAEDIANNFRSALAAQVKRSGFDDMLHVSRGASTVYIYRKA